MLLRKKKLIEDIINVPEEEKETVAVDEATALANKSIKNNALAAKKNIEDSGIVKVGNDLHDQLDADTKKRRDDVHKNIYCPISGKKIDVKDRKDLAKLITEAKKNCRKWKVSRSIKEGYRYLFESFDDPSIKRQTKRKLTESQIDCYDDPFIHKIEEAFDDAGIEYTRYDDMGVLTKNLGWVVEGEYLTIDGSWLDTHKCLDYEESSGELTEGRKKKLNNSDKKKDIKEEEPKISIPEPFETWYDEITLKQFKSNYGDSPETLEDTDIYSVDSMGSDYDHLGWLMAKERYSPALSHYNPWIDLVEVVKDDKGHTILFTYDLDRSGKRTEPEVITNDMVLEAIRTYKADKFEVDVERAEDEDEPDEDEQSEEDIKKGIKPKPADKKTPEGLSTATNKKYLSEDVDEDDEDEKDDDEEDDSKVATSEDEKEETSEPESEKEPEEDEETTATPVEAIPSSIENDDKEIDVDSFPTYTPTPEEAPAYDSIRQAGQRTMQMFCDTIKDLYAAKIKMLDLHNLLTKDSDWLLDVLGVDNTASAGLPSVSTEMPVAEPTPVATPEPVMTDGEGKPYDIVPDTDAPDDIQIVGKASDVVTSPEADTTTAEDNRFAQPAVDDTLNTDGFDDPEPLDVDDGDAAEYAKVAAAKQKASEK